MHPELLSFTTDALRARGGLVEQDDQERLLCLLPKEIARRLHVTDDLVLSPPALQEAHPLSYDAPFLHDLISLIQGEGFYSHIELRDVSTRSGGLRGELQETVKLIDGIGEIERVSPGSCCYLVLHCRYDASCDDLQQGGTITFCCNEETLVSTPWLLDAFARHSCKETTPPGWRTPFDQLQGFLLSRIQQLLMQALAPFSQKVQHRFSSRRRQIERQHRHQRKDILSTLKDEPDQAPTLLQQLHEEEQSFRTELRGLPALFSTQIALQPFAALRISMPVTRVEYSVRRRKEQRSISWIWNPLLDHFEPRACEETGQETYQIIVDDDLTLRAPS